MSFELIWRSAVTLPKLIWWKLRYSGRFESGLVQSLDKGFVLRISNGTAALGRETVTRRNVSLRAEGGDIRLGDKCFLNSNVSITALNKITIGNGCQIANNVVIVDHDHDYKNSLSGFVSEPVTIGNNVWIGANCVILKGSTIGDNCVIAAGSIVKGEVKPDTMYYQRRECGSRKI